MNIIKYTATSFLLIAILVFAGCDEGTDPKVAALNKQLTALMNGGNAWVLGTNGSVTKDDVDVTSQFSGFKLILGKRTYTTQNSLSHVWKSTGTWDFQEDNPNLILRDGSVQVSINHLDSSLTLRFTAAGKSSGGRVNSVSGEYVFQLVSE